ncbi:hypothetical protein M3Y94_01096800 [Aphelenchoides besseyi]|nr:hypothetical protein M3Y94_01096800 [Aphelenchoides besseyi]
MTETYIESERLPFPRLVCASKHCTETRPGIDGLGRIWYKSVCHEPYEFTTSARQYFGNPDFANAPVMNKKGKCRKCGCHYGMHMVVEHKMVEKTREPVTEVEEMANDQTTTEVEDTREPEIIGTNDGAEIKVLVIPTSSTSGTSSPRGGIKSVAFTFGHISPEPTKLPKFSDALTELDLQPKSPKRKEVEEIKEGSVYSNVQTPPASANL